MKSATIEIEMRILLLEPARICLPIGPFRTTEEGAIANFILNRKDFQLTCDVVPSTIWPAASGVGIDSAFPDSSRFGIIILRSQLNIKQKCRFYSPNVEFPNENRQAVERMGEEKNLQEISDIWPSVFGRYNQYNGRQYQFDTPLRYAALPFGAAVHTQDPSQPEKDAEKPIGWGGCSLM